MTSKYHSLRPSTPSSSASISAAQIATIPSYFSTTSTTKHFNQFRRVQRPSTSSILIRDQFPPCDLSQTSRSCRDKGRFIKSFVVVFVRAGSGERGTLSGNGCAGSGITPTPHTLQFKNLRSCWNSENATREPQNLNRICA